MKWLAHVLLLLCAAPAAAQPTPPLPLPVPGDPGPAQQLPAGAFRTTMGGTLFLSAPSGLPSGRLTFARQVSPLVGFHAGALHLAPGDSVVGGGIVGLRFNVMREQLRVAPFLDIGAGRMQAVVDSGGYHFRNPDGSEGYRAFRQKVEGMAVGGGAGVLLEYIFGAGMTLEATAGYWRFNGPIGFGGPQLGVGVRFARRDMPWYWAKSGKDRDAPVFAVVTETDSAGVVQVGRDPLRLLASDMSGVAAIEVNGTSLRLRQESAQPGAEVVVAGEIDLKLEPGQHTVELRARDAAGNERVQQLLVMGPPADRIPPRIMVLSPQAESTTRGERVRVTVAVADESPVGEVTINGVAARAASLSPVERAAIAPGRYEQAWRYEAEVPIEFGRNMLAVAAVDSAGNRGTLGHLVLREGGPAPVLATAAGPVIQIEQPTEWAGAGSRGIRVNARNSIRVVGTVRDASGMGIREVQINGKRAALQSLDASGSLARFTAFAGVDEQTNQVEVAAWAIDGRRTAQVYAVQPGTPSAGATAGAAAMHGQRYAVVIGVSDYADPNVPNLQYADRDARAFYDFLRSEQAGLGGVPAQNIQLLLNEQATYRNIRTALFTFLERATENDVVYIYIAGHGAPNPTRPDALYLLPYDTEAANIAGTAIPMADVNQAIQRLYARHTVLLTDACHSGGVGLGGVAMRAVGGAATNAINQVFLNDLQTTSSGLAIFTASEPRQLSQEGAQWGGGHGVFTYHLLEGLRGAADTDGDQIVRLGELMEYVRDRVSRATHNAQIPMIGSHTHDRYLPMSIVMPRPSEGLVRTEGDQ
jgi:uncharacterized caspase-like protein